MASIFEFYRIKRARSKSHSDGRYRQVLCANSFTSLAELSLHRAGKPALNYLVAEGRERVKGGETTVEYDLLGRIITITDPMGAATAYSYDANGNLLSVTDALGNVTAYIENLHYPDADSEPIKNAVVGIGSISEGLQVYDLDEYLPIWLKTGKKVGWGNQFE